MEVILLSFTQAFRHLASFTAFGMDWTSNKPLMLVTKNMVCIFTKTSVV